MNGLKSEIALDRTFDAAGNLISTFLPSAEERDTVYDSTNRPEQLIYIPASGGTPDPVNTQTSQLRYDANGNIIRLTDNSGQKTYFAYDSSNRRIQTTLPTGESSYKAYDFSGNLASETDFNGNTTLRPLGKTRGKLYDEQGHILQVGYPDGSKVKYYWTCCRIGKYVDATGTATLTYDAVQRLSSITYSTGKTVSYQYNGLNLVTRVTDPDARVRTRTYFKNTRLKTTADSPSNTMTIAYDGNGDFPPLQNPRLKTTAYTYDSDDMRPTILTPIAGLQSCRSADDCSYLISRNLSKSLTSMDSRLKASVRE